MRWIFGALLLVAPIVPASMAQENPDEALAVAPEPFDLETDIETTEPAQPAEGEGRRIRLNWGAAHDASKPDAAPRSYNRLKFGKRATETGRSEPVLKRPEPDFSREAMGDMLDIEPHEMPDGNGCTERDDGAGNTGRTCVYSKTVKTVNGVRQADARYDEPSVNGISLDNSDAEARAFCRLEGYRSGRLMGPGGRQDETVKASGAGACSGGACVAAGRVDCFD